MASVDRFYDAGAAIRDGHDMWRQPTGEEKRTIREMYAHGVPPEKIAGQFPFLSLRKIRRVCKGARR